MNMFQALMSFSDPLKLMAVTHSNNILWHGFIINTVYSRIVTITLNASQVNCCHLYSHSVIVSTVNNIYHKVIRWYIPDLNQNNTSMSFLTKARLIVCHQGYLCGFYRGTSIQYGCYIETACHQGNLIDRHWTSC